MSEHVQVRASVERARRRRINKQWQIGRAIGLCASTTRLNVYGVIHTKSWLGSDSEGTWIGPPRRNLFCDVVTKTPCHVIVAKNAIGFKDNPYVSQAQDITDRISIYDVFDSGRVSAGLEVQNTRNSGVVRSGPKDRIRSFKAIDSHAKPEFACLGKPLDLPTAPSLSILKKASNFKCNIFNQVIRKACEGNLISKLRT